ncbi:hypothetical protein E1B28_001485 [Marasmius oreades]|uniref:BRCA2 OB1 domain-containing protein n=1 Tax=Marasmius oreades TaxID=181124 RepID=A0A9P8AFG9_9AGAR|nr:uncharacterized protein E1B28_001485 [Marasmius oreades]KAG7099659.1 hypothetical protein E1B28_001485 [Marasmius oreades]
MATVYRSNRSPLNSPPRKRQRLSSPDYEDQLNLSQQDLEIISQIEQRLSQKNVCEETVSKSTGEKGRSSTSDSDDPFNPETATVSNPPSGFGFASVSTLTLPQSDDWNDDRLSPDPTLEKDYSDWFAPVDVPMGFQTASASFAPASSISDKNEAPVGFQTASKKGILAPSMTALAKAKAKMKELWGEDVSDIGGENAFRSASTFNNAVDASQRGPLCSLENACRTPETPCPPAVLRPPVANAASLPLFPSTAFQSPLLGKATEKHKPKQFKSPLSVPGKQHVTISPLPRNNVPPSPSQASFNSARSRHPLSPVSSVALQTPVKSKSIGSSSGLWSTTARTTPARFVTPFKPGMKPGESGRQALENKTVASTSKTSTPAAVPAPPKRRKILFDLNVSLDRKRLITSGLVPQRFTRDELESFDLDYEELSQVNLQTARYYSFYCSNPEPECSEPPPFSIYSTTTPNFGPEHAWERLTAMGCGLASKDWVFNHWCLILWKLAGMVALDPETEADGEKRRWSWEEIWNQLLYRYERELNMGMRPPLRRITTQDSPASCPMILCVSNIFWPKAEAANGQEITPHPELEVTDGWYKLRAAIDAPLARAVKKGTLRIGRKIATAGARFDSERKDGVEVLEAYTSCKFILNGNASHLAPWHAKLGFQTGPYIATLRSLTADGGMVPVMDLIVTKVIAIAFWESWTDEKGQKRSGGPRNEADEAKCIEQWKAKRQAAEAKLRDEHEKQVHRYLGYADRLERKAGGPLRGEEPPDSVESLYDELEEPEDVGTVISKATAHEAGWLARFIREKIEKGQETIRDEIDRELDDICPPRNTRSFRVIFVRDAQSNRRAANRTAQLTIWDVLNVQLNEGKPPGYFEPGYRCIVTNLMPTKQRAWMEHEPGDEVYLVSTRATKWQRVKS